MGLALTMKMVAEYLEHAVQFERMAAEATNPEFKASLEKQAATYRRLAHDRAAKLHLPPINLPAVIKSPNDVEAP